MNILYKNALKLMLIFISATLAACGGGGSSTPAASGGATTSGGSGGTTTPPPPAPADRFVIAGNNDGTLSIFRANSVAGYATALGYIDTGGGFAIQDMIYDADNKRLVLITTTQIQVLGIDPDTGTVTTLSAHSTSGNSSHLTLNAAGTEAYVASGTATGQAVDAFAIDSTGTLSPKVSTSLSVDPDYIKLNPAGDHLYVVSRTDDQIVIFGVNSDNSLAASPATFVTGSNPTSLGFNTGGTRAYLTLNTNSDNFVTYDVASDGSLSQASTYTSNNNSPIDQVLSADGAHLYVLDGSSNRSIDHYTIDSASGAPSYAESTNVSFDASDLTLSFTGKQLYVGHDSDALVSTLYVDPSNGSLTPVEWVRAFNNVGTVAAIGGAGALEPMATYLLTPDVSGLSRFSVAADGMLALVTTENTAGALIDGEVAVDYLNNLLLGTGEDASNSDYVTSYTFNPLTGDTTAVDKWDVGSSSTASFQRIRLDRSGRAMYVLDEDQFSSTTHATGTVRTYTYSANGSINQAPIDSDSVGEGPENMSLHPAGHYLYSIDSFGDRVSYYRVSNTDATLTSFGSFQPGQSGLNAGRPLDMQFHPNGRYAYLSLQDDSEIDTWTVETNGSLSNVRRLSTKVSGTGTDPGPIAVHPNGKYVYNGERNTPYDIVVYTVDTSGNYSLTFQSRTAAADQPSWLTVDPQGKFLLARYSDESVEVFSIDQGTGDLTSIQKISAGSNGGFLPTMTLVSPLQ